MSVQLPKSKNYCRSAIQKFDDILFENCQKKCPPPIHCATIIHCFESLETKEDCADEKLIVVLHSLQFCNSRITNVNATFKCCAYHPQRLPLLLIPHPLPYSSSFLVKMQFATKLLAAKLQFGDLKSNTNWLNSKN